MQIPANTPITAGQGIAGINSPKQTTPTPETTGDTVTLSSYAKAKQLKAQGASDSVIAAQLGLDVKTVESYFGTTTAATATATTPQPFGAAHEAVQNTAVKELAAATPTKK